MSPKSRYEDPNQLSLWAEGELGAFLEAFQRIHELAVQPPEPPKPTESEESVQELYVELAGIARKTVKETGLSREHVLDCINALFRRSGEAVDGPDEQKRPLTIAMFNNYLSKPDKNPLPAWLLHAISVVCASDEPIRALLRPGSIIVGAEEQTELLLGKLDHQIRETQRLKRTVARQLRLKRSGNGEEKKERCGETPS